MPIWYNADGLLIKTGRDEAVSGTSGSFVDYVAGNQILETTLTLANLATTGSIIDDNIRLPAGWKIEQVELFVEVAAASGGSATLSMGSIGPDRATGGDGASAFLAAIPLANLTVGKRFTYRNGDTGAGTVVGLATTVKGAYPTATAGTAVFTAGVVKVRVFYHRP